MKKKSHLPKGVHAKHGAYYLVRQVNKQRSWIRLSAIADGLPSLYRALADAEMRGAVDDRMQAICSQWLQEVSTKHAKKTQANDIYQVRTISQAFAEFRAEDVRTPDAVEFLKAFAKMPRTYNAYRSMLRELMRFSEEKGYRESGANPVDAIRTASVKARNRYITDSELRRVKVAALRSGGQRAKQINPAGRMICAILDMAYLTGQRIGDVLALPWANVGRDGVLFRPSKVEGSTGAQVLIEWTPRLRELVARIRAEKNVGLNYVFTGPDGGAYSYEALKSAWRRALTRAGVKDAHIHDLRAKALTDVDRLHGVTAAQRMGAHSTQSQTADYVRHKQAIRSKATR